MSAFTEKFQKICQDAKLVGANIVVVTDDKIIDKDHYGMASLEKNKKTDSKTIYRIASISKTVGAIGLMQLYEEGKIDLEEDISTYFGFKIRNPKFKDVKITPKMLMLQTSSITDGFDDEEMDNDEIIAGYNGVNGTNLDISLQTLLVPNDSIYYTDLTYSDYAPGTNFIYSNFGCGLMACLIEIASGEYYVDYMKNHVFLPLGIDASFRAKDIIRKENIADVYVPDGKGGYRRTRSSEQFIDGGYKNFPLGANFRGPAGGLFIDMDDLSKIMRMFINRGIVDNVRILKKETVDFMYQIHWFGYGEGNDYRAKGLQMKVMNNFEDQGIVFRGHTGGAYGVRSYMYYNEKYKFGVCFITNGGYYESIPNEGIVDVFKYTLVEAIKDYYPPYKETEFSFVINSSVANVDDRQIFFDEPSYSYNGEVYIPAYSLADGLGLVGDRRESENSVRYFKNKKEIKLFNLTDFDGVLMAPVKKVCEALDINITIENERVVIKY